jgi:hypothetical protein
MNYSTSIEKLKSLRHRIKQSKLKIDEDSRRFGFDEMEELVTVKDLRAIPLKVSNDDDGLEMSIKCIPVRDDFPSEEHPTMIEYILLKEFNDNVVFTKRSPHITGYLGAKKVKNSCKALSNFKLKKYEVERQIKQKSLLVISEFIKGGALDDYTDEHSLTLYQWKVLIFQVLYTMNVLQDRYSFMHNDLHYGNILVDTTKFKEEVFEYKINGVSFYTKNEGILPKLWDFEFSEVYKKPNDMPVHFKNKLISVVNAKPPQTYDLYYDVHFFLTSLFDLDIPNELIQWLTDLYPKEVIPERFHLKDEPIDVKVSDVGNVVLEIEKLNTRNSVSDSDSETDSDSDSETDSDSDSETDSDSDSETDSDSDSETDSDSGSSTSDFLWHGRIIEGVGEKFNLPIIKTVLQDSFFDELKTNPCPGSSSVTFE